jgi:sigma-B regulation protein RsbU (phosphoserine phosphatase)
MKQKKIYRTIESIASKSFKTETELLGNVLNEIIQNDEINVTGGRVWKLDIDSKCYRLLFQNGNVPKIDKNFQLNIIDYPVFDKIAKERTILANETDKILLEKGIFRYSASGVGSRVKLGEKTYYQYLLALNSDQIDDELRYTLNIVASVLTSKIKENRLSKSRKSLIDDLDKAKQLQRSILPEHEYSFHEYDLFGVTIPAEILGGDFFDYLKIGNDNQRLAVTVGDAASKGLSAAAEAMYISGAVRMASMFEIKISLLMNRLNELVNKIFSDDRFASLFYGELTQDKKGLFLYANAGHNPPIFFEKKTGTIKYLEPTGPLVGPAPNSRYSTDSIYFNPGDVLVIYSDGITESANDKFEFYEESRLENAIRRHISLSPKQLAQAILDDVIKFSTSNSKYQDDKTVVVIKRKVENVAD